MRTAGTAELMRSPAATVVHACDPVFLPRRTLQFGPQGAVCRCNGTHCDSIESIGAIPPKGFVVYTTSLHNNTERLSRSEGMLSSVAAPDATQHVYVNVSRRFQKIEGFGAAFTDASVIGFNALTPAAQQQMLQSYWSATTPRRIWMS